MKILPSYLVLRKSNTDLPSDQAIPLPGVNPKELKAKVGMEICLRVDSSVIHSSQKVETTQEPLDGRTAERDVSQPLQAGRASQCPLMKNG